MHSVFIEVGDLELCGRPLEGILSVIAKGTCGGKLADFYGFFTFYLVDIPVAVLAPAALADDNADRLIGGIKAEVAGLVIIQVARIVGDDDDKSDDKDGKDHYHRDDNIAHSGFSADGGFFIHKGGDDYKPCGKEGEYEKQGLKSAVGAMLFYSSVDIGIGEFFLIDMDEKVQQMLIDDMISSGHARALLALPSDEMQVKIATQIFDEKLSVRETEKLVRKLTEPPKPAQRTIQRNFTEDAIYEDITERMKGILGTRVYINRKRNNKGKIEIEYYSMEELERIMDLFNSIS